MLLRVAVPSARQLAEYSLEQQHPLTRKWVDDATRVELLAKHHEQVDVLLATDLEVAAARVERVAPGHPAETMLNHWTPIGDNLHAMLSMRFEGMNPAKPFVDATTLSRRLQAGDLPALAAAAVDAYGRYSPQYLRLWSSEPVGWLPGTGLDRRFLGAPIELLRSREVPPGLALTPAQSLAHYGEAERAYAAVDLEHPDHPGQATLADRENLEETAEAGLLFDITVDGRWAGYSAALDHGEDNLGLPAYVVGELILTPGFRGRGFGSYISNLLAEALPDPSRILIGTIHAANRESIQSAIRAGRFDLGGWLQYRLRDQ
jgi:GNAT superfamily N-acetyltransferase